MEFPKKGDIIIADAELHAGHEMGGHNPKKGNIRRHYVVMSTSAYNEATHIFIGMLITSTNYANNSLSEKMIKQLQQYVNDMVGNE